MSRQVPCELLAKNILAFLEETFEKVEWTYLDGGTSLMETMAKISAEEAWRPISESGTPIAAQVDHARFYLQVLRDYMDDKWHEGIDWKGSWSRARVTEGEWDSLRKQIAEEYRNIVACIKGIDDWNDDRLLGGAMAIIVHTAYHLGAIRQIVRVVRR